MSAAPDGIKNQTMCEQHLDVNSTTARQVTQSTTHNAQPNGVSDCGLYHCLWTLFLVLVSDLVYAHDHCGDFARWFGVHCATLWHCLVPSADVWPMLSICPLPSGAQHLSVSEHIQKKSPTFQTGLLVSKPSNSVSILMYHRQLRPSFFGWF